jgi:hypothetical protein
MDDVLKSNIEAERQKNEALLRQQQADAETKAMAVAEMKGIQDKTAQRRSDLQQHQDQMLQGYLNDKVDPEGFWADKSTSQKIMASVAVALGGFAQGRLGLNSNSALDNINKAISDDVENQKAKIGKKKVALDVFMAQGHDLEESAKLQAAESMQLTALKLQDSASKYATEANAPVLTQTINGLKQNAQQLQMQVEKNWVERQKEVAETKLANAHANLLNRKANTAGAMDAKTGAEVGRIEQTITSLDGLKTEAQETSRAGAAFGTEASKKYNDHRAAVLISAAMTAGTGRPNKLLHEQYSEFLPRAGDLRQNPGGIDALKKALKARADSLRANGAGPAASASEAETE